MKSAENRTWYRIALARAAGAPVIVAAQGEHLGAAIAAAERHVAGSRAIAVDAGVIPIGESLGKHSVVELASEGPAPEVPALHWPRGVLPQIGHTAAVAGAARGWTVRQDPKLFVIEAQTDAEHVVDLFLGLLERLPAADNLEIRVLDHFEDAGKTDVWLTSRVDVKKILRFLDDYEDELIHNGHVELSIYVRKHKATLRLTEHKTVVWLADDRELEADVTRWLGELEVPRTDSLVRVSGVSHFHYRLAKSRDRKKLGDELFRQRLRRVDTLRPRPAVGPRETDG